MSGGRPTKLTEETAKKITQAIQLGATYAMAAQYGGVHYDSFNNWMNKGRKAKSGKFFEFFNTIKEAEGKATIGWLAKIEKAANENWQAAAWKLERRYPNDYGRQVKEIKMDVTIDDTGLTDEDRADRIAILLDRARKRRDKQSS